MRGLGEKERGLGEKERGLGADQERGLGADQERGQKQRGEEWDSDSAWP